MSFYLEATRALYQQVTREGWIDDDQRYPQARRELFEQYATPIVLAQGEKFLTTDIVDALGLSPASLGQEQQWVQSLCERMTRKGPINGRMLLQSKDRPRRFFWIVDEEL